MGLPWRERGGVNTCLKWLEDKPSDIYSNFWLCDYYREEKTALEKENGTIIVCV